MKNLFYKVLASEYSRTSVNTSYAYEVKADCLLLMFEETVESQDKVFNLRFNKAKCLRPNGSVIYYHSGLYDAWKSVENFIYKLVIEQDYKNIIICGYSHGAGLSIIAHEYLVSLFPERADNIYTFAFEPPRVVGNKSTFNNYKNLYIFRNGKDIITYLPPKFFGFVEVGNLIHIGKARNFQYGFSCPAFFEAHEVLKKIYKKLTSTYDDHYYKNILQSLAEWDEENNDFLYNLTGYNAS